MKLSFSRQIFEKKVQISSFIKIHPAGADLFHTDGWMDRNNEKNSRFSRCCERAWKRIAILTQSELKWYINWPNRYGIYRMYVWRQLTYYEYRVRISILLNFIVDNPYCAVTVHPTRYGSFHSTLLYLSDRQHMHSLIISPYPTNKPPVFPLSSAILKFILVKTSPTAARFYSSGPAGYLDWSLPFFFFVASSKMW